MNHVRRQILADIAELGGGFEIRFGLLEVLTLRGLMTYYVFFIHLESRKVEIAGITTHPTEQWMKQMARNVTMEGCSALGDSRYLLHDRDTKYTASFLAIIEISEGGVFVTAHSLWRTFLAMKEYVAHYHADRNHQGKSNVLLFPQVTETRCDKAVKCHERLGGLLRYYHRHAA